MATLLKTGDKLVYNGFVLEAQESECTCEGCFFSEGVQWACGNILSCLDRDNEKYIIYKYVRKATDEEIRKGVPDV